MPAVRGDCVGAVWKRAVLTVILASVAPWPARASEGSPLGTWRTPERSGLIEVSACEGGPRDTSLCGKILGGNPGNTPAERVDRNNKNPALRGRPLVGLYVFRGLKPAGKTWEGEIYNPNDGGTYKATATLQSPNELSVRGCVVWPLCKTQVWTRVR